MSLRSTWEGIVSRFRSAQLSPTSVEQDTQQNERPADKKSRSTARPAPEKKKSGKKTPEYVAHFDNLIDIVSHGDKPAFLVKTADGIDILEGIEVDGKKFFPPPVDSIPFAVSRSTEVLDAFEKESSIPPEVADAALFNDLVRYHQRISELPSAQHYLLLAAWDIHTYFQEQFQYSPIIALYAVPERGKSRTGKGMINLAYRGMHVESLREAYIIRLAEYFQASLFLDVMNPWKKAERLGVEDILLQRFERGTTVPRVLFPERGAFKDTVYFHIFGPLIIGTNESLHRILDTRSLQINMPQSERIFEEEVTMQSASRLRSRLLALRARHLFDELPVVPKPSRGRLGDICKPLLQIIRLVAPNHEEAFFELIRQFERQRLTDKSDSLEGKIIETIWTLRAQVDKGILPIKLITDTLNAGKEERYTITYQRVGRRLAALGFSKARTGDGGSALVWSDDVLARVRTAYGQIDSSETSDSSGENYRSEPESVVTDDSDDSELGGLPF
ncbi:MAG: hypothetical protein NTW07_07385 [candidate division Zixibacteria bacterium]|nr:hypothetical protein [candidate division Zixibacteria bacterium]